MRLVVLNTLPQGQLAATHKVLKAGDLYAARRYRAVLDAGADAAQQVIERAKLEGERLKQQAVEEAARERERRMAAALVEAAALRQAAAASLEDDLARLLTEALAVVLRGQPREQLVGLALDAIRGSLMRAKWINVIVNPGNADAAAQAAHDFAQRSGVSGLITIVPSPSLDSDACIVESNAGSADASIPTQLTNLQPALSAAAHDLVRDRAAAAKALS